MKVLHVIAEIDPKNGGPTRSVKGLCRALSQAGLDVSLLVLSGDHPFENSCGVNVFRGWVDDLSGFDIVHIHGLWLWPIHKVIRECRRQNVRYVISTRGMLEPWSLQQKWLKKRIARWLYQDRDLKLAAALHATAESEAEQFRTLGFKNPIVVSPNGVNVPKNFSRAEHVEKRRVLFVSRMHPKKGVMELVEAWNKLVASGWVCELVYTVNGDFEKEYEAKVKARVKEFGLGNQFVFTGALNDDEKWAAYARADLFVLPTYSENFGIVVAEALWAGVPVITTKGTPWHELEERKCGKWIDLPTACSIPSGWPTLVSALESMVSMSKGELRGMGTRGRKLIKEKYTWDAVVKKMIDGYKEVLNGES